jgi:signal transduction histidine kinase
VKMSVAPWVGTDGGAGTGWAGEAPDRSPARVLIVDDDPHVRETVDLALEHAPYTVGRAGSAAEALAEAEASDWDLAFVDLALPDMDGMDLVRELAARRPDLLEVVLTARGSGPSGFAARNAGAYAFLEKPGDMTPEKILTVATNALRHRQAEQELAAWRRQVALSEKLATLGTLVSGVAHEVRTPLTYVTQNLYLVRREMERARGTDPGLAPLVDRVLEFEKAALDGVTRINRLVEDLRRFRCGVEERAEADLRDVVAVAVDLFRVVRPGAVSVETDLGSVPGLVLDAAQIQQVIFNLLHNSAEAMPAGGTVRVVTRGVGDGGEIEVTDDGPGLAPEVQARLFQPFITTKPQGTGVGLALCRRIVEAHGGRIRYLTAPGHGATFVIHLPVPLPSRAAPARN